jgi:poly-gamma-glutamate synthase PgsB/CapB
MSNLILSFVAFLTLLTVLIVEKLVLRGRRKRLKIVVQVNGTRGKSETVRLIHGVLSGNGYRALAKTTGTVPLWIMPDGSHHEIKRRGPANIQEQYRALKQAGRLKCDALIVECMAIRPEMQLASGKILDADLTVITNAYPDHIEEIGASEEATAGVLSLSVPGNRKCLVGNLNDGALEMMRTHCERVSSELLRTGERTISDEGMTFRPHPDNLRLIVRFIEVFGLNEKASMEGMAGILPDVGTFRYLELKLNSGSAVLANAFAANDIRSTIYLLEKTMADFPGRRVVGFFNSRDDRPDRALVFEPFTRKFDNLMIRGSIPVHKFKGLKYRKVKDGESIEEFLQKGDIVFGFGNIRGLVQWLNSLEVIE